MLRFSEIYNEKRKCHPSKTPIDINGVDIDNILILKKYPAGKKRFYIRYLNHSDDNITRIFVSLPKKMMLNKSITTYQ